MVKVYFGAPLFSEQERMYNSYVVNVLREEYGDKINIYLPQENMSINNKENFASATMIADGDNAYLEDADILIAVLDGQTTDVGLSAEIGYFYSMKKPIIAIYSDSRQGNVTDKKVEALDDIAESQFSYINLYLIGMIKQRGKIVRSYKELIEELSNVIY